MGAFSQVAALRLAGEELSPVPMQRFEDVFVSVVNGKCQYAAIPIENTLHGSVHENYDHLLKYDLAIRGETFVRIVHNLIAPPGVRIFAIRRVFSHPVALNQCRHFFEENPQIERTPFYDTAGSVKMVMEKRPDGRGGDRIRGGRKDLWRQDSRKSRLRTTARTLRDSFSWKNPSQRGPRFRSRTAGSDR